MPTLAKITQSIMLRPHNQSFYVTKALNRFLLLASTARGNTLSVKLPELSIEKVVYIGMIKAVIASVDDSVWIAIPSSF